MSKNAQILLENLIEQEFRNNDNYSNISEYFEFFSASQILKNQGLSDDEVDNGIVGKGLDGGCDSIYLFLNNLLITPDVVEHISAPKDSILEMIIIQSKKTTSFGEDAVMKWKTISGNLLDIFCLGKPGISRTQMPLKIMSQSGSFQKYFNITSLTVAYNK